MLFVFSLPVKELFAGAVNNHPIVTFSQGAAQSIGKLGAVKLVTIAFVILPHIHNHSSDAEFAHLPSEDPANIIGRNKCVRAVDQSLIHELGILVIGVSIFVQIIGCVYNPTGKPQGVFLTELKGVLVPNGKQIIPVPAVYILYIIFQVGCPRC